MAVRVNVMLLRSFESKLTSGRFLLEGLICVIIGIVAWFVMAPSISEPAVAFKRKDGTNNWWTEREELILVNRLLRDDPTKGDLNNRTAVSFKEIVHTITTPDLLPIYIVRPHSSAKLVHRLTSYRSVSSPGSLSNPRQTTFP